MRWLFLLLLVGAVAQAAEAPKPRASMKDLLPDEKKEVLPTTDAPTPTMPRGRTHYTGKSTQRCEVNGDCEVGWYCDDEKLCSRATHPHIEETRPRDADAETYKFKGPSIPVF